MRLLVEFRASDDRSMNIYNGIAYIHESPSDAMEPPSKVFNGGVRERPNRTVSKTVVSPGTVGSNPTSSASAKRVTAVTRFRVMLIVGSL